MTHLLTLISNADAGALDEAALAHARSLLTAPAAPRWLAPGIAAEIPFNGNEGFDHRALIERIRANLANRPFDIVVQLAAHQRKRLLIADMDSTMIGQECIDELAERVGLKTHVASITERAMRGEIAFEPALRERVALLKGLPAVTIDKVIAERIALTPGGRTLVQTMRSHGAYTCLVSGGFSVFTERVATMIGFDDHYANRLIIEDGQLTGSVAEPILGREAKLATLHSLMNQLNLSTADTLAIGDGANDLAMLQAAGLGVAYHAKPTVAAAAAARIDHADLTALLYLQGYHRDEFR